jgi:hypothetical protein
MGSSKRIRAIMLLVFVMTASVAFAVNSSPVSGYDACQSTGYSNLVQCSGQLYQNSNGCIELLVPIITWVNDPGDVVTAAVAYYTLHNLPSSYPPVGSWVTVTGQFYQGYNTASSGVACPGNYINVTSIG